MSEPKSSFHPLLKPKISPGTNPMPAAIGKHEAAIVLPCCGYRLRTRPRNLKYKDKFRTSKKADENSTATITTAYTDS